MDLLSSQEILESLDEIILSLEDDETTYYIAVDLAHQLRDSILEVLPEDYDNR